MTIRKQILAAMAAAAQQAPSLEGRVYRSRVAAFTVDESPSVIIRPADESVNLLADGIAERDFNVQVVIIARGEIPDDIADTAIDEIHSQFAVDPSFGGLAAYLFELSSTWSFADTDETACELDVRYRVRLYTPEDSLTTQLQ